MKAGGKEAGNRLGCSADFAVQTFCVREMEKSSKGRLRDGKERVCVCVRLRLLFSKGGDRDD